MTKQQAELENKGTVKGFQVNLSFARNEEEIGRQLHTEGRFILATNDMDEGAYPNAKIISDYKDQQTLERGFRFLKDRWFMVDSIYLKSPKRIEALMMVMSLPNQLEKEVRNPTTKWIFQLMDGIGIVRMQASTPEEEPREWVTNLSIHGLPRSGEKANIQHLFIRQYQIILGPNKYSNVYVTYWENERLLEVP
jgi:hypothetical protein